MAPGPNAAPASTCASSTWTRTSRSPGTQRLPCGEIPEHHDEVRTHQPQLGGQLRLRFRRQLGRVASRCPSSNRSHEHIHNHMGAQLPESWNFTQAGDLRVLGRYQFAPVQQGTAIAASSGLNFGLKLPTGEFDVQNADGDAAERTLQPGSGTTDALLGAYHQRACRIRTCPWFVQATRAAAAEYA